MANENTAQKEQDAIHAIMSDINDVITNKKQVANTDIYELTEVAKNDSPEKIDALLSEQVASDTRKSLEAFSKLMKNDESSEIKNIVAALIKPQLSEWLNNNLRTIVTQVVESEIKKLIPKE